MYSLNRPYFPQFPPLAEFYLIPLPTSREFRIPNTELYTPLDLFHEILTLNDTNEIRNDVFQILLVASCYWEEMLWANRSGIFHL